MSFTERGEIVHVNIGASQIINSDCKLSSENHIDQVCTEARVKIKALTRIAPFLNKGKRKLVINAFFKSQFSYFPFFG